jgi:hypothetical protein
VRSEAELLTQAVDRGYRHELKYYINKADYTLLSAKLSRTMARDEFARQNGGEYFIRSLYFDDLDDTAFRDKLSGVDNRDKYRIRIYNLQDSPIKLERKHKKDGFIHKEAINLTREECERLILGDPSFLYRRPEPFARELFRDFITQNLKAKVIVDYTREPYVFPVEDVRVTFDKNIRTGYRSLNIFDPHLPTYPVADEFDMVMEVKFNRYLPTYIRSLLQAESNARSAISKYCLSRKFEL